MKARCSSPSSVAPESSRRFLFVKGGSAMAGGPPFRMICLDAIISNCGRSSYTGDKHGATDITNKQQHRELS